MTRGRPASSDRLSTAAIAAILALYLALALIYNAATPIFEASDEFRHFTTIHYLVRNHRLPVLQVSDDPLAPWQEAGQPPLYYLAGAALTGWIDTSDLAELDFNPHAEAGIPSTSSDNKNLFVHPASEDFPYGGASLAAHLARLLSIVLGAGTVFLTWRLARLIAPATPSVAVLGTALVAFNPQFLFVSASVDNDNAITLAATAALLLMAQLLLQGVATRRLWLLSGALGCAVLSKLSGLGLPPVAALVVAAQTPRSLGWAALVRRWAVLAVGPIVVAGWWFARNWAIYGEPTGLRAWGELIQARSPSLLKVLSEAPGLFLSYWAVFGAFDIETDGWVYAIYGALCLAGTGGLLLARRHVGKELRSWRPVWLLIGWFALELAALARWTMVASASTGRLLFPASAPVAVALSLGLVMPVRPAWRMPFGTALSALLLALAAYLPFRYIFPAYARPEVATSAAAIGKPTHPARIDYGGQFRLLGYDVSAEEVRPGDEVTVGLYWQVVRDIPRNYSVTVQLLTSDGLAGQYDSFPGQGRIATRHLRAGQYFHDTYRVQVLPAVQGPLIARLKVGLYQDDLAKVSARDASDAELAEPIAGELTIAGAPPRAASPVATFGGDVQLLAGAPAAQAARSGQSLDVDLQWQATRRLSRPYTVFVHLADASGKPWAQHDSPPRDGALPTILWAPGQIVRDSVRLALPPGLQPGRYELLVGLYDSATLQRLPVSGGGDAYDLGPIQVTA